VLQKRLERENPKDNTTSAAHVAPEELPELFDSSSPSPACHLYLSKRFSILSCLQTLEGKGVEAVQAVPWLPSYAACVVYMSLFHTIEFDDYKFV
jgi:hypothetical protein